MLQIAALMAALGALTMCWAAGSAWARDAGDRSSSATWLAGRHEGQDWDAKTPRVPVRKPGPRKARNVTMMMFIPRNSYLGETRETRGMGLLASAWAAEVDRLRCFDNFV